MDKKQMQEQANRLVELLQERGWDYDDAWTAVYLNGRVEIGDQVIDVQVDDEELAAQIEKLEAVAKPLRDARPKVDTSPSYPTEWETRSATGYYREDGE